MMTSDLQGSIYAEQTLTGSIDTGSVTLSGAIHSSEGGFMGTILPSAIRGYSNYELAVQNGFVGTLEEYLQSLVGESVQIEVVKDSDTEFILSFTVGEETVTTPNLIKGKVFSHTTAEWNSQRDFVAQEGVIYIYLDGTSYVGQDGQTHTVPSFKIGDGTSYLIDLPFGEDMKLMEHASNTELHITNDERAFWNGKVRVDETETNNELLVFTTQ